MEKPNASSFFKEPPSKSSGEENTAIPNNLGLPFNGILRLYNQFPRCYQDINQMTLQLPYIAAMGFNAVWINPIQETGKKWHDIKEKKGIYRGSLYAMKNDKKIDDDFTTNRKSNREENIYDINAIKTYTKTAKNLGLTPIFDLVLNHVAVDAEIYQAHPTWFVHPSRHFGEFCCDFNYESPDACSQIMPFWKEYIRKYIVDFGFLGVRVDAVKHIPIKVQKELYDHIYQLCNDEYHVQPIIFAEVFLDIYQSSLKMRNCVH